MSAVSEARSALVGAILEALNNHDPDALYSLVHPDYEFHARFVKLEGRVYAGRQGFHDYFRDLDDTFVDLKWELTEMRGAEGDSLLVVVRFTANGRESGIPIDRLAPQVWSFRDGLVWRNVSYGSKDEALVAAGLPE
jgi:ketosteroid isomerase-like protein